MLKFAASLVLVISFNFLSAQHVLKQEFVESPYGSSSDTSLPVWVRKMYCPNPSPEEVRSLYRAYYRQHPFEKNEHTQYFKRWMRGSRYALNDLGQVAAQSRAESDEADASYLGQLNPSNRSFGPGSIWSCIGPFDFDKDAAGRSHAPGSAHVYTVEKSASNPQVLYAGTATAGIFKSTDNGANWQLLSSELLINSCRALEIQFNNPDVVYAGGNGRIYKTTDGGISWTQTGQSSFNAVNHTVYSIAMVPGNSQKLFASTNYGLYRTNDGGANWIQVVSTPGSGEYMGDIEFHPTDTSLIYAVYNAVLVNGNNQLTRFYRSTNGGNTFSVEPGWPSTVAAINGSSHQRRAELAVTPADPNRIYAILTGSANGGEGLYGFFRSDDAGITWTHLCCGDGPGGWASTTNNNVMGYATDGTDDGGQYYYDLAIAADPLNADKVHVGGIMQWVSTDAGASFTCLNSWSNPEGARYVHADIHDIRIYGNEVWVACDGGIFRSEDGGETAFQRRQFGISGTDFWGFGAGFKDGNVMLGGTYHNSHLLKNNSVYENGWISYTGSADGYRGFVNPGNNKWVYNDSRKDKLPPNRTTAFTAYPFSNQPNASYVLGYSCPLVWHPRCYTTVFSGVDSVLWKSTDDGLSWTALHDFGVGEITDLEIAIDNPDRMFVVFSPESGSRSIWRTDDGGLNWINITAPPSVIGSNTTRQLDLTIDEHQSDNLWLALLSSNNATNNYKVFRSINGGTTWTNYSSSVLNNQTMQAIVHQRGSDGGVYLGTNRTVYYRNNSMSEWTLYSEGLPAATSCMKLVPWYKGGKIRNASDRSVWQADLYELTEPVAHFTADKLSSGCARDTFYLSDYSVQYGAGASWNWQITPQPQYISSSTSENIKVVLGNPGTYTVSLSISDSLGTDAISYANMLEVANGCEADTVPGKALEISADGQYASAAEPLQLNSNAVTFSAWIKPGSDQPNWAGLLFFRGGSTTCGLNFNGTTNKLGYHWDGGFWGWNGGPVVPVNQWAHVALVVTPSSATIYLNGIGYTNTGNHPAEAFDTPLRIGNDPNSAGRTFKGLIDEVCIYNRSLSQTEIRALMHLTKKPQDDLDLKTYLQFNETAGQALDRSGTNHASFVGGCNRNTSTGPFGAGVSAMQQLNGQGTFSFGATGITITTSNGGVAPGGETWISRINQQPDALPVEVAAPFYLVFQNFGNNASFDTLESLRLENLNFSLTACDDYVLHRRNPLDDGDTWGAFIDDADSCQSSPQRVVFGSGNNVHEAGQWIVASGSSLPAQIQENPSLVEGMHFAPNPLEAGSSLRFFGTHNNVTIDLFDSFGRLVFSRKNCSSGEELNLGKQAAGTYYVRITGSKESWLQKLVII
ncbi:MAG: LamG-like jellyroll fold domain-containing protein [Bacteroidia bacterium]